MARKRRPDSDIKTNVMLSTFATHSPPKRLARSIEHLASTTPQSHFIKSDVARANVSSNLTQVQIMD